MKASILPTLLARLKALRAACNWTQEEFSEKSGISYKYYQALEAGRKPDMRLSTLERIATAYGIEIHELFRPNEIEARRKKAKRGKRTAG